MAARTAIPWLIQVSKRANLTGLEAVRPDASARLDASYEAVAEAAGLEETELARHVAAAFRLNPADLSHPEPKALKLIPEKLVRGHAILPLRENDRTIVVATSDPTDVDLEQAVAFATGRRAEFQVAAPAALRDAINNHYSPEQAIESLLRKVDEEAADAVRVMEELTPEMVNAQELLTAPIIKLTNLILREGVRQEASDIHIEPGAANGTVRLRVDGVLRPAMQLPIAALSRVISRLKILSKLDIANRLRPQDGRARIQVDGRTYDLRISTVPTRDSEKAVIRILDPQGSLRLNDLAMNTPEEQKFRHMLGYRDGIVIVTGPTGSGKTTSLYAAIHELATGEVNIMTVEDPIEYELPGITQIQVEPRRNVTFASALRAVLRQDPDVIFVGEIRDTETARIAAQAAATGHLVLATLHTNDAVGVVARLIDLGLERATIAANLRGVIAQRLVRRICAQCNGAGCKRCGQTGYRGRIPIDEVLTVTPHLQELITSSASALELERAATAAGMRRLREVAAERVRSGETTQQEVDRVLGEAEPDVQSQKQTVLVVDDDAENRLLANALLESAGYAVLEAKDGIEALHTIEATPGISLVILDLDMPRLDGRAVLAQLRRTIATASLPVIVLTGSTSEATEVEVMDEGADDYLRKPIDPARFTARVRATLRRKAL